MLLERITKGDRKFIFAWPKGGKEEVKRPEGPPARSQALEGAQTFSFKIFAALHSLVLLEMITRGRALMNICSALKSSKDENCTYLFRQIF